MSHDVTMFLCGDVMTGRGIDQVLPCPSSPELHEPYVRSAREYVAMAEYANGPIPKPVTFDYIWGAALDELNCLAPSARIVNLETSITTNEEYEPKGINYRMHPANAPCLAAAKIDCCVLANNHVLDCGRSGLIDTVEALRGAGFKTAGAGRDLRDAIQPAILDVGGPSRLLVVAAGTADSGIPPDWAATDTRPGIVWLPDLSLQIADRTAELLLPLRNSGRPIVLSIHWGGNWGYEIPYKQRLFARRLIDCGSVDVVYGHSSHHPKSIEIYRNKTILYGCGDFLNDYEGIAGYEEFRTDLVLMYFVTLDRRTGDLLRLRMTPLKIKRFQLVRAGAEDALWLAEALTREGSLAGTRAILKDENRLELEWRQ